MPDNYPPIDAEGAHKYLDALLEKQSVNARLSPEEFQRQTATGQSTWTPDLSQGGRIARRELNIPSASGQETLPALVLTPKEGGGPFPCIYYTANGGKMMQGATVALTSTDTAWVADLRLVLVSISPRVGPEHPHPAQVEDAYTGLRWIVDHAAELNVDPSRIITMGKSGGGGIAAALGLLARDRGGPAIANQLLIYPMLDDRLENPSSNYDVPPWTTVNNQVGWRAILGETVGGAEISPYAAPARAEDLANLPPTYMEVGSSEVFRDECIDFAARIARAGGSIELHSYMGGVHGFEIFTPETRMAQICLAVRTNYLERALYALDSCQSANV